MQINWNKKSVYIKKSWHFHIFLFYFLNKISFTNNVPVTTLAFVISFYFFWAISLNFCCCVEIMKSEMKNPRWREVVSDSVHCVLQNRNKLDDAVATKRLCWNYLKWFIWCQSRWTKKVMLWLLKSLRLGFKHKHPMYLLSVKLAQFFD